MTNGLHLAAARTLASLTLALEGHVTLKIVIYVKNINRKIVWLIFTPYEPPLRWGC